MRLKMTTDYAIRIIRTIYMEEGEIVTTATISEKEHISQGVIMKILKLLRDANLVSSHQGRGDISGGFSLNRELKEMTLYDVIIVMEGPLILTFPRNMDYNEKGEGDCPINRELQRINDDMIRKLQEKSLFEVFNAEHYKLREKVAL